MRNRVKNKLRMYRAVRQVVQKNNSSWSGFQAFEDAVTKFIQKLGELEVLSYKKSKALVGARSKRDEHHLYTGDLALKVSNAIYAYAAEVGDSRLKEEIHYSPSQLKYSNFSNFTEIVDGILKKAKLLVNDLDAYGVDQDMIDELELAHMEMIEIINLPRQAVVTRKVITEHIDKMVDDLDNVLSEKLDRLIVLLKEDEFDFFLRYENARTIIDHPATRRKLTETSEQEDDSDESPEDQDERSP